MGTKHSGYVLMIRIPCGIIVCFLSWAVLQFITSSLLQGECQKQAMQTWSPVLLLTIRGSQTIYTFLYFFFNYRGHHPTLSPGACKDETDNSCKMFNAILTCSQVVSI